MKVMSFSYRYIGILAFGALQEQAVVVQEGLESSSRKALSTLNNSDATRLHV